MDINEAREKLNQIDDQIVPLFVERMKTVLDIAQYKKDHGLTVLDRSRETDILNRVTAASGEEFAGYTRILFNTLFDLSRSYQSQFMHRDSALQGQVQSALQNTPAQMPAQAVVACQGVEGAYSQAACEKLFGLPSIMYFKTFEAVFNAVDKGMCRYGILPIENSSAGSVNQVYDLMKKFRFSIVRGVKLRINHTLLAKKGVQLEGIKEIYSHEQGLNQCSEFLRANPQIKANVCENTAVAAKLVAQSDRTDIAAISSRECAELYGLQILSDHIQNSDNNYTRFICISRSLEIYPGADKMSLMFSLPHRPGALYSVITKFATLGLNLTKLESRPIPGKDFEFMFYFDASVSAHSEELLKLLAELEGTLEQFSFLGCYAEIF